MWWSVREGGVGEECEGGAGEECEGGRCGGGV